MHHPDTSAPGWCRGYLPSMPLSSIKAMIFCRPSPLFRLVKLHGRSPRMRRVSRSITSRDAPTYGARSVLLITVKSDLVIPGPPLRGIFSFRHVDDVDSEIRQLRAEGGAQVIAAAFYKDEIEIAEFLAQRFHRGKVHRRIFPNSGMRAAAGFDADNSFRLRGASLGEMR